MFTVRPLSHDSPELFRLHLRRLGLEGEGLARGLGAEPWAGLVTGAGREALVGALGECAGLARVETDPERAPGTLLLSGTRGGVFELAARLRARGGEAAGLGEAIAAALVRRDGPPAATLIGRRLFEWGRRSYVMGIVNVTPDSFSDGGRYACAEAAVAHGEALAAEGADLLDVGGESTRPGSNPVTAEQEIERVVPVIARLARLTEVPISVDTTKAAVAEAALAAGASLVNDVSGFRFDPEMAGAIARHGAAACAMHLQGLPRTMQQQPRYLDVVGEVIEGLRASVALAERCGVAPEKILVDPGIGFGKTTGHNLFLLRNLAQLRTLGRPILVGASRKRFIGELTGREVHDRLSGSLASHVAAVLHGADLVRVHEVAETLAAVRVADALARAAEGGLAFEQG